jgi:hypothetical protein
MHKKRKSSRKKPSLTSLLISLRRSTPKAKEAVPHKCWRSRLSGLLLREQVLTPRDNQTLTRYLDPWSLLPIPSRDSSLFLLLQPLYYQILSIFQSLQGIRPHFRNTIVYQDDHVKKIPGKILMLIFSNRGKT